MFHPRTTFTRAVVATITALTALAALSITAVAAPQEGDVSFRFITKALTQASVGEPYRYEAQAIGSAVGRISYKLENGPDGMKCDSATGLVTWPTPVEGSFNVQIRATLRLDLPPRLEAIQNYILTCVKDRDSVNPRCASLVGSVTMRGTGEAVQEGIIHAWRTDNVGPFLYSNIYTGVIANGTFSLMVPEGTYVLNARSRGEAGFTSTWYAADSLSSLDITTAERIEVTCGDTTNISFEVNPLPAPSIHTLTGMVIDAETMAGLRATVVFTRIGSRLALLGQGASDSLRSRVAVETDVDGRFTVDLADGRYMAMAMASAELNGGVVYVPQFYDGQDDGLSARSFLASEINADLEFALRPRAVRDTVGSIHGKLTASVETAVTGIVSAYRVGSGIVGTLMASASVATDAEGAFEIDGLAPGDYILCVKPDNRTVVGGYFVMGASATAEWQHASVVNVASSAVTTADVTLRTINRVDGFARIIGTVQAEAAATIDVGGALITCLNDVGQIVAQAYSDMDGMFTLDLLATGQFTLICNRAGYESSTEGVSVAESDMEEEQNFMLNRVTSVAETSASAISLNFAPNPATQASMLTFDAQPGPVLVRIIDVTGRTVALFTDSATSAGPMAMHLPLSIQPGWYLVSVQNGAIVGSASLHVAR